MNSDYVWYCNKCLTVRFDTSNAECNLCRAAMDNIGFVQSIEDAIWWGQKHPEASIAPSIAWEAENSV